LIDSFIHSFIHLFTRSVIHSCIVCKIHYLTVRLCIQKTLNVCAWGTKYTHLQYQIFSTIGRRLLAELHVLVQEFKLNPISCFRNYKMPFFEILRKFQRHCFYCFPRNVRQLREGLRHLLVIRAVRRGGCDSCS